MEEEEACKINRREEKRPKSDERGTWQEDVNERGNQRKSSMTEKVKGAELPNDVL